MREAMGVLPEERWPGGQTRAESLAGPEEDRLSSKKDYVPQSPLITCERGQRGNTGEL
jgi:hypothetical protein